MTNPIAPTEKTNRATSTTAAMRPRLVRPQAGSLKEANDRTEEKGQQQRQCDRLQYCLAPVEYRNDGEDAGADKVWAKLAKHSANALGGPVGPRPDVSSARSPRYGPSPFKLLRDRFSHPRVGLQRSRPRWCAIGLQPQT
jgi:hypothetical protein